MPQNHLGAVPAPPRPEPIPSYRVKAWAASKVLAASDALMYWCVAESRETRPATIVVADCPEDTIHEALSCEGVWRDDYSVERADDDR